MRYKDNFVSRIYAFQQRMEAVKERSLHSDRLPPTVKLKVSTPNVDKIKAFLQS